MFYLLKFADLYPHIRHNNSEVRFGPFNPSFVLHSIYEILLTFEVALM